MRATLLQVIGLLAVTLVGLFVFMAAGAIVTGVVAAALLTVAALWAFVAWFRHMTTRRRDPVTRDPMA